MLQGDVSREYDVFLSYARKDLDHDVANARNIAQWLESIGYSVWWDTSLMPGDDWPSELEIKLRASKRVIVLWSPRAASSDWVKFETNIARNEGKRRNENVLIPLIIEECPTPIHWGTIHQTVVTDFEAQKAEILKVLAIEPGGRRERIGAIDDSRVSIAALPTTSGALIGRDHELSMLQRAWASTMSGADPSQKTNIVVLHAIGGAGKTALMRHFLDGLADTDFAGAYKIYGWSAYSQGAGDNRTANADEFIARALVFFGHDLSRDPIHDAVERGRKLVRLVSERRSLLILDGLEPLQELPHISGGRLKDRGLATLIKDLAAHNKGLLIITSRQELPELKGQNKPRIIGKELNRLDKTAGTMLLAHLGVHGKRSEMEKAVEEVLGHALSLNLLGTYLDAVFGGDVNQRDHFSLGVIEDAPADFIGDQTERYAKRAARIIEGTVARFEELEGRSTDGTETAILHVVGLFDRPAEKEALNALLAAPPIPSLTDSLYYNLPTSVCLSQGEKELAAVSSHPGGGRQGQGELRSRSSISAQVRGARWNVAVDRLRKLRLLNVEDPREPGSLDAHPIVRAHFGLRLQHHAPQSYREAHSRLYKFYRLRGLPTEFAQPERYAELVNTALQSVQIASTGKLDVFGYSWFYQDQYSDPIHAEPAYTDNLCKDELDLFLPRDLAQMSNCFFAIAHGCAAGLYHEAYTEVYIPRIRRGFEAYIGAKLGALGADLATLFHFFERAWDTPASSLSNTQKSSVQLYAAFALRALGRFREAGEAYDAILDLSIRENNWENAAGTASGKAGILLSLGDLSHAAQEARKSVEFADKQSDPFPRMATRTRLADILFQAGEIDEALVLFRQAEALQKERQSNFPRLYAARAFRYCELLLSMGEMRSSIERATYSIEITQRNNWVLDLALDNLILGRSYAYLYSSAIGTEKDVAYAGDYKMLAEKHLDAAVEGIRAAGREYYQPRGILARAAFRRTIGNYIGAATDLNDVKEIAAHSEMRLHLTDYHLESARLLLAQLKSVTPPRTFRGSLIKRLFSFPRVKAARTAEAATLPNDALGTFARPEEHYGAAKKLIGDTGYRRRLPELDAIRACLHGQISANILHPDRDRNGHAVAPQLKLDA